MTATAIIEKSEDGKYAIVIGDELKNHVFFGIGDTLKEAKADFFNSLDEMRLSYTELGKEIPDEIKELDFKFEMVDLSES